MNFNVTNEMLEQLAALQDIDIAKLTDEEKEAMVADAITKNYERLQDD